MDIDDLLTRDANVSSRNWLRAVTNAAALLGSYLFYVQQMEKKLRSSFPRYRFHDDYIWMSESCLLGAMDYLQSLPDHRNIVVYN